MRPLPHKKDRKRSFNSILSLICIPLIIVIITFLSIYIVNYIKDEKSLKSIATSEFASSVKLCEEKIDSVLTLTTFLSRNPILKQSLEDDASDFTVATQEELLKLKNSYSFIQDVFIFNRNLNKICSSYGIFFSGNFFADTFIYSDYDQQYWHNIDNTTFDNNKFLFPSKLTTPDIETTVLPVIIKNTSSVNAKNLIVFNLNFEKILYTASSAEAFPDFDLFICDNTEAKAISTTGSLLQYKDFPDSLHTKIKNQHKESFEYSYNKTKYLIVPQVSRSTADRFTYFAMIPEKNITPGIFISLSILLAGIFISVILALRSASLIFTPLYKIYTTLTGNRAIRFSTGNLLNDISFHISKIQEQNEHLATALPYAQEKYLINYLNATEHYIDESARDIIANSINFPYDYFAVLIIRITPTDQMFDLYNSFDYTNIQGGLYNVIKELFAEKYTCFVLPGDRDTLYIVLNMSSSNQFFGVDVILKDMYTLLEADMEYINLSVGKSSVYEGLNGLKLAHSEAIKSMTPHVYKSERIILDIPPADEPNFTHKDESEFFSALISFDSRTAYTIFDSILEKNSHLPTRSQKHLFNNIANIILKAMRIKEIPFKDNKLDFEILNEILNQPPENIKRDIADLIAHIMQNDEIPKPQSGGINADEIVDYIKENFTSCDLSLEFLATHFHTAPSNISNIIKASLKIGYHEYLTSLRINASKELLSNTDKSITQIFKECGFSSQQTFYRAFKKSTGLTPLEFRSKEQV